MPPQTRGSKRPRNATNRRARTAPRKQKQAPVNNATNTPIPVTPETLEATILRMRTLEDQITVLQAIIVSNMGAQTNEIKTTIEVELARAIASHPGWQQRVAPPPPPQTRPSRLSRAYQQFSNIIGVLVTTRNAVVIAGLVRQILQNPATFEWTTAMIVNFALFTPDRLNRLLEHIRSLRNRPRPTNYSRMPRVG